MTGKRKMAFASSLLALGVAATIAYAALPSTTVPPNTVPLGTLAGKTALNVLSVSAFARAINQDQGSNGVLQHLMFTPNQSTGWHTHPGPAFAIVMTGSLTLTDEHCNVTTYGPGEGFATGLKVHEAVAGPDGADFYAFYLLPGSADVLRTTEPAPNCAQ
jgi:quercetin dioxygenase-like cupin family protein